MGNVRGGGQGEGVEFPIGPVRVRGVMTTAGLRAIGLSPGQIHRLARNGSLRPLRGAVYAPTALVESLAGGEPGEHLLRVAAATISTGAHAAGSHRSAATVYGLGLTGPRLGAQVNLTRAPDSRGSRTRRPGIVLHVAALPADQVTMLRGVPLTTVARTVIDLARCLPFEAGVAVADSALYRGMATRGELDAVLARCARWPGVQRARRAVAFADPRAESVLESLGRAAFHQAGLPPPDLQVWVGDDGEVIGRADFLWRQYAHDRRGGRGDQVRGPAAGPGPAGPRRPAARGRL